MKRSFFFVAACSFLASGFSPAIIDTNHNGLSDLWEKQYNSDQLFANINPQDDPDGDGWTNAQEAAAGTDPHDPNPPDGLLLPDIAHIPAVPDSLDENSNPVEGTPESVSVTWPTAPGKQYTLLLSVDLSQGSWIAVEEPFIGTGTVVSYYFPTASPEKQFWRVAIEDTDSDSDGLTDAEELQFGTNPTLTMTFPGIPDAWLAAHFPTAVGFDPDGDTDGDGLTDAQEYEFDLDPNSTDTIGPVNFGFGGEITDNPTIDFRPDHPSDLYEQDSVEGWQAVAGEHVEIWDEDDGNPYAELQSHLGAHGVKQEFKMLPGSSMSFILQYKGRYEWEAYENAFDLKVEGASEMLVDGSSADVTGSTMSHSFMDDDESDTYSDWHYASISITAEDVSSGLAEITLSLEPQTTTTYAATAYGEGSGGGGGGEEDITHGGFVDLAFVKVEDNEFATGVDNVSRTAKKTDTGYQEDYWIMAPSGQTPTNPPEDCENDTRFLVPLQGDATHLKITPTDATVTSDNPFPIAVTDTDNPDTWPLVTWHGTSATTTEPDTTWEVGKPPDTWQTAKLPVKVKVMKRRTVKVIVHYVTGKTTLSSGNIQLRSPTSQPSAAQIIDKLYGVFTPQINTWFVNLECVSHEIAWDVGTDSDWGTVEAPVTGTVLSPFNRQLDLGGTETANDPISVEERALLDERSLSPDTVIDVFVVGGCWDIQTYIGINGVAARLSDEHLAGVTKRERRAIYLAGELLVASNPVPEDLLLQDIAHEIGHVLVGAGHPDDDSDNGSRAGVAPLKGTNRMERLMFSDETAKKNANLLDRNLLVKKEWDEAEAWLSARPNGDN